MGGATGREPWRVEPSPTRCHRPNATAPRQKELSIMTKNRYIALILGSSLAVAGSAFAGVALAGADCDKAAGHMGGRGGAHFERLDADKDGKISLAELTTTRETWLAKVDTNRDG